MKCTPRFLMHSQGMVLCKMLAKWRFLVFIITVLGVIFFMLRGVRLNQLPLKSRLVSPAGTTVIPANCTLKKRPLSMYSNQIVSTVLGNRISGYPQVTYLCHDCPAVCNSDFPYVHMPELKLDTRLTYVNGKDINKFRQEVAITLEYQPEWRHKTITEIEKDIHRTGHLFFTTVVLQCISKFANYSKYGHLNMVLNEVALNMHILHSKVFPDRPRAISCQKCFTYDFKNIITPKDLCGSDESVEMVGVITTVPLHTKARQRLRDTWASKGLQKQYRFKVVFLFGTGWPADQVEVLQKEHKQYNDILMDNFTDSYFNLTQKVLMGFHWVLRKCPQAKFVMRGADDTTVSILKLLDLLKRFGRKETFQKHQVGSCFTAYEVYRGATYKGYMNTLEYPQYRFPPYALGTVFLTSIKLTRELVEASVNVPYLSIEDSYFGLVLAKLGRGCHHVDDMVHLAHHKPL